MNQADISIRDVSFADKKAWDAVVSHPLQSWAWGEFRKEGGVDVARLAVFQDGKMIEGWQLTFHKVPHTSRTIGYFPKGPKPGYVMLDELTKLAKAKRAIFIQLEPNVITNDSGKNPDNSLHSFLSDYPNFVPSHHPLFTKHTFVLNLTNSPEAILAAMQSKTRYNIKVAQKHGVTIQEDNSHEAFNVYLKLVHETTGRQKFYSHDDTYHKNMWETMHASGIAHLFTATFQKEILSAWIVFIWKDTIYYPYGASSRNHREVMAPNLMLWEIARWAKEKNLKYFDLWGSLGPSPDVNDAWYGFHRFKAGYNPTPVEFIGSYDLVANPLLYNLYSIADSVRWKYLMLKRQLLHK